MKFKEAFNVYVCFSVSVKKSDTTNVGVKVVRTDEIRSENLCFQESLETAMSMIDSLLVNGLTDFQTGEKINPSQVKHVTIERDWKLKK
jgi:hypothetical protein